MRALPLTVVALALLAAACRGDGEPAATSTGPVTTPSSAVASTATTPATSGVTAPAPASTVTSGPASSPVAPRTPQGYAAVMVQVVSAGGTVQEHCVWLAATPAERGRGLMEVDDLGGAAGMLFRFGQPTTGQFYMLRTRIPLSIAFLAADGSLVSTADMVPCPDDDDDPPCPRYAAAGPFTDALETTVGGLGDLGVVPGARVIVSDESCTPA